MNSSSLIPFEGKINDETTIGKYGLGFNCCYHFTDVVSFVSGDQLVYFDPHSFDFHIFNFSVLLLLLLLLLLFVSIDR